MIRTIRTRVVWTFAVLVLLNRGAGFWSICNFYDLGTTVTMILRENCQSVLAATNRNLEEAVQIGAFREELYYKLNAVKLRLPPLRDRVEDIPLLAGHFLKRSSSASTVQPEVLRALAVYPRRGNVRELNNVVKRAVILARGEPSAFSTFQKSFRSCRIPRTSLSPLWRWRNSTS